MLLRDYRTIDGGLVGKDGVAIEAGTLNAFAYQNHSTHKMNYCTLSITCPEQASLMSE